MEKQILMTGEVVLVTGASRGIGRAIAEVFVRAGARVMLNYLSARKQADSAIESLKAQGGQVVSFQADVSKAEQVDAMFAAVESRWSEVTILVNNAGTDLQALVTETSETAYDRVMQVNLKGAFLCARRALPAMIRKKQGKIINIGSVYGNTGAAFEAAYAASKGGLAAFSRSLAAEAGPSGINVNLIAPGAISTDMLSAELDAEELDELRKKIPLNRIGNPQDIAEACLFLASPAAGYINGQVWAIDGGWTA